MADDGRLFTRPDAPHRVHDLLLVAAYAANDADPADQSRAEALVKACTECRALADDLGDIQRATAELPAPTRTRDFRLTRDDAARLRPHGGVRRIAAAVSLPRLSRAQPIAAGLTMLGLAGLLVSTISFGGAASAPGSEAAPVGDSGQGPAASEPLDVRIMAAPADSPSPDVPLVAPAPPVPEPTDAWPRAALAIGSAALVTGGVALFVVANRHRRRNL